MADGAASFYIDHYVAARVARASYGIQYNPHLDGSKEDHRRRLSTAYTGVSGYTSLVGAFGVILKKGTIVPEKTEFRQSYCWETTLDTSLMMNKCEILAYCGSGDPPSWVDEMEDSDKHILCSVTANMTGSNGAEIIKTTAAGKKYKQWSFDIVLLFGGPEFKAQICWKEQGVEKRGPAKIVFQNIPTASARQSGIDLDGQPSN